MLDKYDMVASDKFGENFSFSWNPKRHLN